MPSSSLSFAVVAESLIACLFPSPHTSVMLQESSTSDAAAAATTECSELVVVVAVVAVIFVCGDGNWS